MLSDNSSKKFDTEVGFDENNYKSCFARSVVVNSQYQQFKILNSQQEGQLLKSNHCDTNRGETVPLPTPNLLRHINSLQREHILSEKHRRNIICDSKRSSAACSSRIADMPVENLLLRSQIDTLEWQLKHTEASREMYRAVMKQVVKFLERAHHSLQLLGSKLNPNNNNTMGARTQSEHQMVSIKENASIDEPSTPAIDSTMDYTMFRDFTWRRQKKSQPPADEIPLEKLSQEAFRLLRTAESLLNTRAPDLANVNHHNSDDISFMEQLAKEFPRIHDNDTLKPNSSCTTSRLQPSPPEEEVRISRALNRKLSMQRSNATNSKRGPFHTSSPKLFEAAHYHQPDSNKEISLLSDLNSDCGSSVLSFKSDKTKSKFTVKEKNSSPSCVSAEDESGFSSMNSFQEIGIPLMVTPALAAEEQPSKEELLKSMLVQEGNAPKHKMSPNNLLAENDTLKELKLWEKPNGINVTHKRWNSMPVKKSDTITEKQSLKVLWV